MKTIIAGSRTANNYFDLLNAIDCCGWHISTIVSGGAKGADAMGEFYAKEHNIPLEKYPANWELYGKRAGFLRNQQMAENADALIVLWDGISPGTKNMIDIAKQDGLRVHVQMITPKPYPEYLPELTTGDD